VRRSTDTAASVTHGEVVIDELGPVEQVREPVEGGQLAAQQLLALLIGDGVRAPQVVHRGHHAQACRDEEERVKDE